ncbi:MAG: TonB-dependent receptor [Bryobacterales bacterium]|nr:TonB-dependent receptor [Bryobacterales bacterium]
MFHKGFAAGWLGVLALALFGVGVLLLPAALSAQGADATVRGQISDESGGVVPDALIELESIERGFVRETRSNGAGQYVFANVAPGRYRVRVPASAFALAQSEELQLSVGSSIVLSFTLKVGARAGDTVDVLERADAIGDSAAVSTVIDRQFIGNQPLNGRTLQSLIALSPGVTMTPARLPSPGQFSVNGQRASANNFLLDGVSANFGTSASVTPYEPLGGTVPALTALGSTASLASLESLEEFSIQTSTYSAEFGRQPGAQVTLVTRSGTNSYHGSAVHYFRNDKLDANNWFANANQLPRQALRLNDFAFTLGGPVVLPAPNGGGIWSGKDRTFFFVSHETLLLRQPFVTPPLNVPSAEARAQAQGMVGELLRAFPQPIRPALEGNPLVSPYIATISNPARLHATSVRLDHVLTSNWNLFGRFHESPSDSRERAKYCATSCISVTEADTRTVTGALTGALSPTLVSDFRGNFSLSTTRLFYEMDDFGGAVVPSHSTLYPSFTDGSKGYLYLEVDPAGDNTLSDGLFVTNQQRQLHLVETLSWVSGTHAAKFGADYRRLAPFSDSGSYRRQFRYPTVAALAQDSPVAGSIIAPDVVFQPRFTNFSLFAQDAWRATPRLTVSYGVRWDLAPSPGEANGNLPRTVANLDNPSELSIAKPGTEFYSTTYSNFAPRLGVAYRLDSSGDTVVRGGVGMFYDLGYGFVGNAFNTSLWPFARVQSFSSLRYGADGTAIQPPPVSQSPPYARLFAYEDGFRLPRIMQYSLAVERAVTRVDSVSVSYVGASGRRLGRIEQIRNLAPGFTRIDAVRSNAESNYNGLQLQYRRRLSAGLQVLSNYTWSKSLDTASEESISNFFAPSTRISPSTDRGPSSFDVAHQTNTAVSYLVSESAGASWVRRLAGGFSFDGIYRARSALPVNVLTGRDPFGIGITTVSRPDLVPGVPVYLRSGAYAGGMMVNAAAFDSVTPQTEGRQGTLGRNAVRGFEAWQVDLSAKRAFAFGETVRLEFQADAFNLFNHASFFNPLGTMQSSNFGRATQMLGTGLGGLSPLFQMGGPRSVQLALRLKF